MKNKVIILISLILHFIVLVVWFFNILIFSEGNTSYMDQIAPMIITSVYLLSLLSIMAGAFLIIKKKSVLTAYFLPLIPVLNVFLIILIFGWFQFQRLNNWGIVEFFLLLGTVIGFLGSIVINSFLLFLRYLRNLRERKGLNNKGNKRPIQKTTNVKKPIPRAKK